jgi:hypothetical protein
LPSLSPSVPCRVARKFPNQTIVCVATGPSLTAADVALVRGRAPVVATNDAYRLCPLADALVAADASWWLTHQGVPTFSGEKWSVEHNSWGRLRERWPEVKRLTPTGDRGIETDPAKIRTGRNSGYLALGLAVHYGASKILLIGYDMGHKKGAPAHFFGDHPGAMRQQSPYAIFIDAYKSAVAPLKALGVEVVNCSRSTALACFRRGTLEQELPA